MVGAVALLWGSWGLPVSPLVALFLTFGVFSTG